jgi:lipopolysaccharide/colanic/teichoic acid biosynthesis glycosyltransferase
MQSANSFVVPGSPREQLEPPLPGSKAKRIFDAAASCVGLVILSPLLAVIAVLVKLSDGGPVFYRQERVGMGGRPFTMFKFRSMVQNASRLGPSVTQQGDSRITRIGRILRKTKLDELPQLWNVLIGDMSFVGPRPEVACYVQRYTEEQRQILAFKPGITDLATLVFRDEEVLLRNAKNVEDFYVAHCIPRKCKLNLEYARGANLWQDLLIILRTVCPASIGILCGYGLLLAVSFWLACQLRFDFHPPGSDRLFRVLVGTVLVSLQLLVLFWRGHLEGLPSFFGVTELKDLAVSLGVVAAIQCVVWPAAGGVLAPRAFCFES